VNVLHAHIAPHTHGDQGKRVTAIYRGPSGRRFKSCQPDLGKTCDTFWTVAPTCRCARCSISQLMLLVRDGRDSPSLPAALHHRLRRRYRITTAPSRYPDQQRERQTHAHHAAHGPSEGCARIGLAPTPNARLDTGGGPFLRRARRAATPATCPQKPGATLLITCRLFVRGGLRHVLYPREALDGLRPSQRRRCQQCDMLEFGGRETLGQSSTSV